MEVSKAGPIKYDMEVVRWFTIAAAIYAVVGTLLGVIIASQLAWPAMNFDLEWITFGRLRPLHTNAVVFAFGGSVLMATGYYIVQRTGATALWSNKLAWFTFIGWNLIIVSAVITLPLGMSRTGSRCR
jgi:cytochrome c oxidase cbb3-type subunit 1